MPKNVCIVADLPYTYIAKFAKVEKQPRLLPAFFCLKLR